MEHDSSSNGFQSCRKLEFETDDAFDIKQDDHSKFFDIKDNEENGTFVASHVPSELVPTLGMEFDTEQSAYAFYQAYAKAMGFGTRTSAGHKDKKGSRILDRIFCCSREGKRGTDKRNVNVKSHRPETTCNCTAKMKISCRQTKKYLVIQFIDEHNHELSTPSKTHMFRSHRRISSAQEAEIDTNRSCGIPPKQSLELMSKEVGGRENLGFIRDDLKNYLRSKRSRVMMQGDTGGLLEYLQRMQLEDPNFFYAIQVDEDDLITNIFWADGKMRTDYAHFGDVVCFDTTYRKHRDGRPIALFVGVNHHKKTTIFGAALLYDETIRTFEWLFDTFSRSMMEKTPKTILTDQDGRMAAALASQWPTTYHRLCIWHIYQNAAAHLSDVFANFKEFANEFSNCIYDKEDEDDFTNAWNEMLEKYNLKDNKWLQKMFDIKEKWALVYGRETFCADMTTTQRSETMNSVLKRYVSYKNDLLEFFNHFQRLLDERRYEESIADFKASQSTPAMMFPLEILKHAARVYTYEVFEQFKDQLCKGIDSKFEIDEEVGYRMVYKITPFGKKNHHLVTYDSSKDSISCSCKKFEFAGILCSHSLKILTTLNVVRIPADYILRRWTRKAKKGNLKVRFESKVEEDPKARISSRYKELSYLYMQLVTKAAETEEGYKIAKTSFSTMSEQIDACSEGKEIEERPLLTQTGIDRVEYSKIRGVKVKEKVTYKTSTRPKNALEKATKKRKFMVKGNPPMRNKGSHVDLPCQTQNPQPLQCCRNNDLTPSEDAVIVQNLFHQPLMALQGTTQDFGKNPMMGCSSHQSVHFQEESQSVQEIAVLQSNATRNQQDIENMTNLLQIVDPNVHQWHYCMSFDSTKIQ